MISYYLYYSPTGLHFNACEDILPSGNAIGVKQGKTTTVTYRERRRRETLVRPEAWHIGNTVGVKYETENASS